MKLSHVWRALESSAFHGSALSGLTSLQRHVRSLIDDHATETPILELYKLLGIQGCVRFARSWPTTYDLFRTRLNEETVSVLPKRSQERARRLIWRIDAERSRHSTPLGATRALTSMALESMFGENGLRDQLRHLVGESELTPPTGGNVIPFRRR